MNKSFYYLLISFISIFFLSLSANAERRYESIYGRDDRVYLEDYKNTQIKWYSLSVAAMVHQSKIEISEFPLLSSIEVESLASANYLCKDERFANDMTTAKCSAFLVGKDLLMTAGHCITGPTACQEYKFIFEFRKDLILTRSEEEILFPSDNIYGCKEIIHREYNYDTQNDYSLIRLDREVIGREPLKFRTSGKIDNRARVVALGHPSGLPLMAHEGRVLQNKNPFFFNTNVDTFAGNSGGPVINLETGLVEGIVVRGEEDFFTDSNPECDRPVICKDNGENCHKEDVTRITVVPELVPGMTPANIPYVDPDIVPIEDETSIDDANDDGDDDDDDFDWNDFWDTDEF